METQGLPVEARSGHTAAVYQGAMHVFAGRDGRTYFADLHSYDFGAWPPLSPSPILSPRTLCLLVDRPGDVCLVCCAPREGVAVLSIT